MSNNTDAIINDNTTTYYAAAKQDVTISGRHFIAQGPSPVGSYILVSDAGTEYLATQAYMGDETLLKVMGGRQFRDLYIHGNRAMLRADESGRLQQVKW